MSINVPPTPGTSNSPSAMQNEERDTLDLLRHMNIAVSSLGGTSDLSKISFQLIAHRIKDILQSPALSVSIFIREENEPNMLILKGNVGYRNDIGIVVYDAKNPSLTFDVYKTLIPANRTAKAVEARSLARCRRYLEKGHFSNVLAVPICISSTPDDAECFGVLKVENDGHDTDKQVRPEIEEKCKIIAHLLAVEFQLHWCANLWRQAVKGKHENGSEYLKRLPVVICKLVRGQGAFVYTPSSSPDELIFRGGTIEMPDHTLTPDSLLSTAGNTDLFDNLTLGQLPKFDPFLRDLRVVMPDLRSLLVASIVRGDRICGVLVLAKEFGDFTPEDETVAKRFAGLVGENLDVSSLSQSQTLTGFEELVRRFGPPARLKGRRLISRVAEMQKLRDISEIRITGQDCANHLQISRPYFLKRAKEFREEQSVE